MTDEEMETARRLWLTQRSDGIRDEGDLKMNKETETGMKKEQTFIENQFGTVTNKRVIFFKGKDWFSGGSREDIPLQHVTSVRLDNSRSVVIIIGLLFFGFISSIGFLGFLVLHSSRPEHSMGLGFGLGLGASSILCMVAAFLQIWGSPIVVVNTAGQDRSCAAGFPWQNGEANAFVNALRKQLFAE